MASWMPLSGHQAQQSPQNALAGGGTPHKATKNQPATASCISSSWLRQGSPLRLQPLQLQSGEPQGWPWAGPWHMTPAPHPDPGPGAETPSASSLTRSRREGRHGGPLPLPSSSPPLLFLFFLLLPLLHLLLLITKQGKWRSEEQVKPPSRCRQKCPACHSELRHSPKAGSVPAEQLSHLEKDALDGT